MARLTVVDGPNKGATYDLGDVCLLGRALDCQVHIQDLTVSRRHAKVTKLPEGFQIEDLGSGNGTFVNEELVTRRLLDDNDIIRVSGLRLQFADDVRVDEQWIDTPAFETSALHAPEGQTFVGIPRQIESNIFGTVDANRSFIDDVAGATDLADFRRMASRLQTMYAIFEAISSKLEISELLPEILNHVFDVFPAAGRAFILLKDPETERLVPKATKMREDSIDGDLTISRTILKEVLTNKLAVLSRDAMADARFVAGHSVAHFGIRSMMCAPIIWRSDVLGMIYIDGDRLGAFAKEDLELLNGIAGQSALAVGNAHLHEQLMKRQRVDQDLQLAERIQQSFLPRRIPTVSGFTFCTRYDPAYEIGGDFYDFISLPGDRLGMLVGDVSGKGVAAALYMARMTRDLRYFALSEVDPGRVLSAMNRSVLESDQDDIFVTLVYAVLETKTAALTIANAGHMPPIVRRRAQGQIHVLDRTAGLPLGVLPDIEYDSDTFTMQSGDTLLLYSDGLVEAMSPAREMYGMDRLVQVLSKGPSGAVHCLERALADMQRHVANAAQFDDTTVVCASLDNQNLLGTHSS